MGLLDVLSRWLKPEPIDTAEALERFMDSRAAFLAQKCVVEYCRARSGILWQKLFKEQPFQAALHESRWITYSITYCDISEMMEGLLRDRLDGPPGALQRGLLAMAERTFARHGLPAGAPGDFWDKALERMERRLAAARLHEPKPVRNIPKTDMDEVFANLPIHESLRGHDYQLVQNHLRTNIVRIYEDFLDAADLDRLAEAVAAEGAEAGPLEAGQAPVDHL